MIIFRFPEDPPPPIIKSSWFKKLLKFLGLKK